MTGRETYKGIVRHSARWDTLKEEKNGMDWSNMRVGVIGVVSAASNRCLMTGFECHPDRARVAEAMQGSCQLWPLKE